MVVEVERAVLEKLCGGTVGELLVPAPPDDVVDAKNCGEESFCVVTRSRRCS